ncbi:hypothetical protein JW848_09075 [Candidatus Bipolaricaulota bacterium]|nr:hypothetical protein [Candidatus Bipolaricaulota bacterium]
MTSFERWSLVVGGLAAIATFFAVAAALWGERLRQRWNKPKLVLSLLDPLGETNRTQAGVTGRYYGIRVTNEKESCPARNTRVVLLDILVRSADGEFRSQPFTKPTQVSWRWPKITPPQITVGPAEVASFLFLMEPDNFLQLQLQWYPNNLNPMLPANQETRLVFQAVSDTARSVELVIDVVWDGVWAEGSKEMGRHLIVKHVSENGAG